MNTVRPIKMTSPSGISTMPRISERRSGDKIYVEAHWYDPASGMFFHKGIVEVKDVEKR